MRRATTDANSSMDKPPLLEGRRFSLLGPIRNPCLEAYRRNRKRTGKWSQRSGHSSHIHTDSKYTDRDRQTARQKERDRQIDRAGQILCFLVVGCSESTLRFVLKNAERRRRKRRAKKIDKNTKNDEKEEGSVFLLCDSPTARRSERRSARQTRERRGRGREEDGHSGRRGRELRPKRRMERKGTEGLKKRVRTRLEKIRWRHGKNNDGGREQKHTKKG